MEYFAHSQKAFVYKYVVMMSDTDQFKHMSFANYLKLMFLASDALFLSCLNEDFLRKKRLRLLDSRMQFKRQSVTGEHILIKVNSSEMNGSQFTLLFTFMIEGTAELVALGRQTYEVASLNGTPVSELSENLRGVLGPIRVEEEHLVYKY